MAGWMGAVITSAVVNGVCQGLILTALVWLALRLFPRTPAATRHAIWSLTLVVVAALPLLVLVAPAGAGQTEAAAPFSGEVAAIALPPDNRWLVWVIAGWAAVALLLVARVAWSYAVLQRLKRRSVALPDAWQSRFDEIQRACPGRRRAELLASAEIAAPVAAGLRRPAVLVPAVLVEQLSEAELGNVLAHELAHLRRGDDWTNLVQRLIEAVAFFHPAVLWIGRRLSLEREIACDDWVVALTGTPRPYAACLAKLAAMMPAVSPQLAPGAVSRKPQISIRVEALLASRRSGGVRPSKAALAFASAGLAIAGTAALPFVPVSAGELPVPALSARMPAASVPEMAYTAPRPAAPVVAREARVLARARRPARSLQPSVFMEEVTVAAWRGPVVACYIVRLQRGEAAWIQVVWVHAPRAPAPLGHA